MGKAEGHRCAQKGRSPSEESWCSEADEPGGEEKAVGARESAVGRKEEGWGQNSLVTELVSPNSSACAWADPTDTRLQIARTQ